jgi:hypothetical protein
VLGDNALDAYLTDGADQPVPGASLHVELWMPAHGHGSSSTPHATEAEEPGHYRISDVVFEMPGRWEVLIDVTAPEADRFVIPLTVE